MITIKKTKIMKKIILGAILLFSTISLGQTITLSENSHLTNNGVAPHVSNCSNTNGDITINGGLDLNGFTLYVKQNTTLTITGSLITNGGSIELCNNGNNYNSVLLCINGSPCITLGTYLSTPTFNFTKDYGFKYKVYDMLGRLLVEGTTDSNTFNTLPKNRLLILKVESFKEVKIYNN